jgi:sialate O-acetylesterase
MPVPFPYRILMIGACVCATWAADLALPTVFSDHMVLQQGQPIPVWGQADAGEVITVTLGKQSVHATATAAGTWRVELAKLAASSQPQQLRIVGQDRAVTYEDVLVGEVWLCSGQSNMAFKLSAALNAEVEIADADHPQMRMFHTMFQSRLRAPETWDVGSWQICTPQNAPQFSAVAYFFARQLQQELQVPIGIVVSAVGGTSATSWVTPQSVSTNPALKHLHDQLAGQLGNFPPATDTRGWQEPTCADSSWKTMNLPTAWEKSEQGMDKLDGAVWFRREITIPETWTGHAATLHLGPVDDGDTVYINGHRIGGMNVDTPMVWTLPRQYPVPANVLTPGRNVIAMRITDQLGDGGVVGAADLMHLTLNDVPADTPDRRLPLAGPWKFAIEESWPPQQIPTTLYTGMVAPWTQVPIAGVAWYQGESDASNSKQYHHLLSALITGWRTAWNQPKLPFAVVQLPSFGKPVSEPANSNWAGLREAQAVVASTTAHTSVAITLDLGEPNDIHPKNKQGLGLRLAQVVLHDVYNQAGTYTGPICDSALVEGQTFRLHFAHIGKGLVASGDQLSGFAIAGADNHFVWAKAQIEGDTVIASSPEVSTPTALRYAWADSPAANLTNGEGFPAAPFRCDGSKVIPAVTSTP